MQKNKSYKIILSISIISSIVLFNGCKKDSNDSNNKGKEYLGEGCTIENTKGLDGYFVSPFGDSSNIGDSENPISLEFALSKESPIHKDNKTIWVCPGAYKGLYTSYLKGSIDNKFIVSSIPNKRATIDTTKQLGENGKGGYALTIHYSSSWTNYIGLEVTSHDGKRVTEINSYDNDITLNGGVNIHGSNVKVINFVVHDNVSGIDAWSDAIDSEIYGSMIYNNGWSAPGRGHGHAIYTQNKKGTRLITDNIIFFGFGTGIHAYTEGGQLKGFNVKNNVWFMTGASDERKSQRKDNCLIGGFQPIEDLVLDGNYGWSRGRGTRLGYVTNKNGVPFTNINTVVKNNVFNEQFELAGTWNNIKSENNKFYSSIIRPELFTESVSDVFQKPTSDFDSYVSHNKYEDNRYRLTIYNWKETETVDVNLNKSSNKVSNDNFFLKDDKIEVYSVFDIYGEPIYKGIYDGVSVTIPMGSVNPPQPHGLNGITGDDNPGKEFGVFIVRKVN